MRKLITAGILCSTLLCGSAFAGASKNPQDLSYWLSNYYIGVQPGYANTNYDRAWLTNITGFTSVSSVESRDYAGRIFIGYSFNPFISLESGYLALQGIKFNNINGTTNDDINQTIIDLVGKATLPMGYIGLFVKAGGAYVHRNELKVGTARYRANNKYVPAVGGGLSVFVTDNVTLGAEYDRYIKSGDFKRTDFYSVSAIYQFA